MFGLIVRQGEQGQQIRDIISESEGERKGVNKQDIEEAMKIDAEETENHKDLVEEELIGKLGMEGKCNDEPPDEIINSPVSMLNIYRTNPPPSVVHHVKVANSESPQSIQSEEATQLSIVAENSVLKQRQDQQTSSISPLRLIQHHDSTLPPG